MKAQRYRKLEDGERVALPDGLMQVACCDCGLVHVFKVARRGAGGFTLRSWRHRTATQQKRRSRARRVKR